MEMSHVDVLVIGAGFAGASTAFHLSRTPGLSIRILDKESLAGFHASGRNAALVLQSVPRADLRQLLAASRRAYQQRAEELGFRSCGSILLGMKPELEVLREPDLIPSEFWEPEIVRRKIPILQGHHFEAALWTPGDGVMDISRLLEYYLSGARARGAELWLDQEVIALAGKGPFQIQTRQHSLEAAVVVNAAGAWASHVGRLAGLDPPTMTAFKRHLFVLGQIPEIDPSWPFVWDLDRNFYFRPESGGLLFSLCDETAGWSPFEPTVDPGMSQALAEFVWHELPRLRSASLRKVWSCFRTKSPHDAFWLQCDSRLPGFIWVAALGGHGMAASWEVGRRAARKVLDFLEGRPGSSLPRAQDAQQRHLQR